METKGEITMIVKRMMIEDKETFVQLTKEEAIKCYLNNEDIIFTDENEKEVFIESLESKQPKSNKKMKRMLGLLPFLEDEQLSLLVDEIIKGDETIEIDLMSVVPFLNQTDCDRLFDKIVIEHNTSINPISIAPFVSEEALSQLVDKFIEGRLKEDLMDDIYPFLSSKDINRLFTYLINK
jgi:hypothetical protein